MAGDKWTAEEIVVLYSNMDLRQMSRVLGRTMSAIYTKRHELRLKNQYPVCTKTDREIENEYRIIAMARRMGVKLGKEQG